MKKRICLFLVCMLLISSLAACGSSDSSSASSDSAATETSSALQGNSDETYYMCVPISGVEYWFPVFQGMKDAAKALGVNC